MTSKKKRCGTLADGDEFIEEAIRAAVAKGLLRDSGRRRNGQIVWIRTDKRLDDEDTENGVAT